MAIFNSYVSLPEGSPFVHIFFFRYSDSQVPAFHLPAGTPASATGQSCSRNRGMGELKKCRLLIQGGAP